MLHTCQPVRLRTPKMPGRTPMPRRRVRMTTSAASTRPVTSVAGASAAAARHAASISEGALRMAVATTAEPAAMETTGRRESSIDDSPNASTQRRPRGGLCSGHHASRPPTR